MQARQHLTWLLLGAGVLLLGIAWTGANPPSASPDEPAHVVKAYATGRGEISGSRTNTAQPSAPASPNDARQRDWFANAQRAYRIPRDVQPSASVPCYAFYRDVTPACLDHAPARPSVDRIDTQMATYPPFLYVPSGLAMQVANSYDAADRLGRLVNVLLAAGLITLGAFLVWDRGRAPIALAGLVAATTPMVLFLSASATTSGVEAAAAICTWAALLCLTRPGPVASTTWAWIGLAIGGVTMQLSRSLDPGFLIAMIVVALVARERVNGRRAERRSISARVAIAVLVAAGVVCLVWSTAVTAHPPFDFALARHALRPSITGLPNQLRQVIGIFGWNETTMPQVLYWLWIVLIAGVGALALWFGTARQRVAFVLLGAGVVLADIGIATVIEAQIGYGMQARYVLPLAVGVPMLACEILQRRPQRVSNRLASRLCVTLFVGVAVLQFGAFVANLHRYVVGQGASWSVPWKSSWLPPGGLALWLLVALVGAGCIGAAGWAARSGVDDAADARRAEARDLVDDQLATA